MKKRFSWGAFAIIVFITLLAILIGFRLTGSDDESEQDGNVKVEHVHGLGYSKDGTRLLVAAHDGLKIFSDGKWSEGQGEKNDYMGFSTYDEGFFSSGHPATDSKLSNPLGIVRSVDEGESVEPIAYYGQIDFHLMTAGYRSRTLYVYNPEPHPDMEQTLYYSKDEGKSWTRSSPAGIAGEITAIAAHPDQAGTVVIGTVNGAYLSIDYGNSFEPLLNDVQITGLSFSPEGKLFAGTYQAGESNLVEITLDSNKIKPLPIPTLVEDAVAFIAVNPINEQEISFVTFNSNVYKSSDGGNSWVQILGTKKSALLKPIDSQDHMHIG